jgi:hypothetical protein
MKLIEFVTSKLIVVTLFNKVIRLGLVLIGFLQSPPQSEIEHQDR